MPKIETLLLDAGGVLVVPNWTRVSETLQRHGVDASVDALRAAEPAVKFAIDTFVGVSTSSDAKRWGDYLEGVLTTAGVPLSDADPRGPSRNPRVPCRQQSLGGSAGGRRSGARTHSPARPDGGRRLERQRYGPARVRSPWAVVVLRRGLRFAFRRRREAATPVLRDRARAMRRQTGHDPARRRPVPRGHRRRAERGPERHSAGPARSVRGVRRGTDPDARGTG